MAISDALALGFIMCAKGIVDLGAYTLFKEIKVNIYNAHALHTVN